MEITQLSLFWKTHRRLAARNQAFLEMKGKVSRAELEKLRELEELRGKRDLWKYFPDSFCHD